MNRPRILLFALVVLTILLATGVYLWQVTGRTRATQALAVDDTMPASAVAMIR
jgi:CHASE3 domain sensor protein